MSGLLTLAFIFFGTTAAAHPGHWGELLGHDHWVAGAAIGLAGIATIWGALKGKKEKDAAAAEEETDSDEAAA